MAQKARGGPLCSLSPLFPELRYSNGQSPKKTSHDRKAEGQACNETTDNRQAVFRCDLVPKANCEEYDEGKDAEEIHRFRKDLRSSRIAFVDP